MFRNTAIAAMVLAIGAMCITGCSSANKDGSQPSTTAEKNYETSGNSEKFSIVCTIFPEYDWVREIMGSHAKDADITYLLDSGTDLHNFQPTAEDILKISSCDLFIHVGGESDKWVSDALNGAVNKDMQTLSLMAILGDSAKEEEIKDGMEAEEEHDGEEEEEEIEYDEHVWLSLKNSKLICEEIEKAIAKTDPENAPDYGSNLADYAARLDELDRKFASIAGSANNKVLIFGDRFPFRYFVDDYDIDYYAAFAGCSAESEASFKTVSFLSDKLSELNCDTIFTIEKSDKSVAEAVIANSKKKDCSIVELDSIQSVSSADAASGVTYLSLMEQNYNVLAEYFN
ncbi:metal ABC transporter substrate-binding protein [Ruminococcus sp.]|uniref:metal ABC transporter substrate-binding protein n=1 Tax=Ruminococcus sp. TaxID=41978 RepID=UPI001B6E9331|nr:metal ABC transporter substrate-binding protein [Ruminococcus sp.]MBP5434109.1 zinc ABC transporter substrate-binding protein [Ruminococcus sp.]